MKLQACCPTICILLMIICLSIIDVHAQYNQSTLFRQPFHKKGNITLHIGNNIFLRKKAVSPQPELNLEIGIHKNFAFGPMMVFYRFKRNHDSGIGSLYIEDNIIYNQLFGGIKAKYYLSGLIESMLGKEFNLQRVGVYSFGYLGYAHAWSTHPQPNPEVISTNKVVKGGVGIGMQTMVFQHFGIYLQASYGSFSYASIGMSLLLNRTKP